MTLEYLTVPFKIHNPSSHKRATLDHALFEYTSLMEFLLDWSKENIDHIRANGLYRQIDEKTGEVKSEKYTEKSITLTLPKPGELKADIASSLKEALVKNVSAMLASYLQLDNGEAQEAGFPVCRDPSPMAYDNAMQNLCDLFLQNSIATTKKEAEQAEDEARAKMLRVTRGSFMPLYFSRSRDFRILEDRVNNRFFLMMKLLANDSPLAEKIAINQGNLFDIRTGEAVKYNGKSEVLFPIEVGQKGDSWGWQYQKFILPIIEENAFIKSARLFKQGGEYFFNTSVGFEKPKIYNPLAYLGIDRGVLYSVAYGVVDLDGAIIEIHCTPDNFRTERIKAALDVQRRQKRGKRVSRKHYRQRQLDGILHHLVNEVLDVAEKYQAMIVFEDLNIKNLGKFYKSAYEKIYKYAAYKASFRGIPIYSRVNQGGGRKPGVWAAYTSQICIYCGCLNKERKRGEPFNCPECSAVYHSDAGAGINIARRAMYRAKDWGGIDGKPGDYWAFHRSFANVADFGAKIDLRDMALVDALV